MEGYETHRQYFFLENEKTLRDSRSRFWGPFEGVQKNQSNIFSILRGIRDIWGPEEPAWDHDVEVLEIESDEGEQAGGEGALPHN